MKITIAIVALYAGFCLVLFLAQRSFIYFPTAPADRPSPSDIALDVQGAILRVTTRIHDSENALIYFGGNAEDVSLSLAGLSETFPQYAIYLMHYRGYGGSTGKPSEKVLHADAQRLFDTVHAKHTNITLIGRSLGSGVAVRLAATNPVDRLVLVTPYDSVVNLARQTFPFVPVNLMLTERFESWRYAPQIDAQTSIAIAQNDEIIPRKNSMALLKSFRPGIAQMTVIENSSHNTISNGPNYMNVLRGSE